MFTIYKCEKQKILCSLLFIRKNLVMLQVVLSLKSGTSPDLGIEEKKNREQFQSSG